MAIPELSAQQSARPAWQRPGRTLLVASTGGHLDQLYRLRQAFSPQLEDVEWVTFDTGQSRHLLSDEVVHWVPFIEPKDLSGTRASAAAAIRMMRSRRYVRVISTGAAVAVPFVMTARSLGMAAHYIESAARSTGPSLSGSLVSRVPGVRLYAQYASWTAGRWQFRGAVFDGYKPQPARPQIASPLHKVVVTFGTQRGFGFRRAVDRLVEVLPQVCSDDVEILWQTGFTDTSGLGIKAHQTVPSADLESAVAESDLVVSHSGIGSALLSLKYGRCPVLLPRRRSYREHTDNHQQQIAEDLSRRNLAVYADASTVTVSDLLLAAGMSAVAEQPSPFVLQPD